MEIVKDSWKKMMVKDYVAIGEINARQDDSDEQKQIAILSILCDCDEDEIWNLSPYEVNLLRSKMWFLSKLEASKQGPSKLIIDGEKYEVNYNVGKMTYAQFVDFNTYYAQNLKADKNLASILSTLIIPKGKKYNQGYDVVELAGIIQDHLNVQDAVDILFFFLLTSRVSEEITQEFLAWMMKWKMMTTRNKQEKTRMESLLKLMKQMKALQAWGGSTGLKS